MYFRRMQGDIRTAVSDGWADLGGWGRGVKDGFYCKAHADALETMLMDGSLYEIDACGDCDVMIAP